MQFCQWRRMLLDQSALMIELLGGRDWHGRAAAVNKFAGTIVVIAD